MIAFGLAHLGLSVGFVAEATGDMTRGWTLREVARLPGEPQDIGVIAPGLFAAKTSDGVVVFNRHGPIGCSDSE